MSTKNYQAVCYGTDPHEIIKAAKAEARECGMSSDDNQTHFAIAYISQALAAKNTDPENLPWWHHLNKTLTAHLEDEK